MEKLIILINFISLKKLFFIFIFAIGLTNLTTAQLRLSGDPISGNSKLLRFYPNPAVVSVNFDFQRNYSSNKYALSIFNFMGKRVFELKNISSRTSINLDDFYRGIYIYQLRDKNGVILESGKFQVQK